MIRIDEISTHKGQPCLISHAPYNKIIVFPTTDKILNFFRFNSEELCWGSSIPKALKIFYPEIPEHHDDSNERNERKTMDTCTLCGRPKIINIEYLCKDCREDIK